jgi:hypothetical protein
LHDPYKDARDLLRGVGALPREGDATEAACCRCSRRSDAGTPSRMILHGETRPLTIRSVVESAVELLGHGADDRSRALLRLVASDLVLAAAQRLRRSPDLSWPVGEAFDCGTAALWAVVEYTRGRLFERPDDDELLQGVWSIGEHVSKVLRDQGLGDAEAHDAVARAALDVTRKISGRTALTGSGAQSGGGQKPRRSAAGTRRKAA